jgi:uncharacterized protein (DUF1330 family)
MSVYYIVTYQITNPDEYPKYVEGVVPLLMKHKCEILAADYEGKQLEGEPRGANIILKFPDEEHAMAWYNDPEYEKVKQIRLDNTTGGNVVLLKQFVPPGS